LAAEDLTDIVEQHIVVLGCPGCVGHDALEEFAETDNFDFEAGFFLYFPDEGVLDEFARFDSTAGKAPKAFEGLFAALDEEDAVAVVD
jgi:hypothetical protein